ncbi:LmeA family phospholipid-binding protein [Streptomyces sp. URMC 123]|uniref:LmeA family phospholipid-binding protein n=1 Tax=Streptomyces sp. URMC 123 TaxID=3423403 RepID=UPI003F1BEAE7
MRALRIILILAVIFGGIFVAVDRFAVGYAEDKAASKLQSSQGLAGTPDVSIKGFPFLTQIAFKQLDEVDVNLDGVSANAGGRAVRVTRMSARLHDVRLQNNLTSAIADRATGTAHISYADLTKAAGDPAVTVSYGGTDKAGKSQVKVGGTVTVFGRTIQRSVLSTVSIVDGDTIRLRADAVPGAEVPGLERMVRQKIDFDREISGLPKGMKLDKVEATPDGIQVTVAGSGVVLAG